MLSISSSNWAVALPLIGQQPELTQRTNEVLDVFRQFVRHAVELAAQAGDDLGLRQSIAQSFDDRVAGLVEGEGRTGERIEHESILTNGQIFDSYRVGHGFFSECEDAADIEVMQVTEQSVRCTQP